MVSLYAPMPTMSKNQCATQTPTRQNWKSNKKSVFNACCDQYSDLVTGVSPWWNRLSAVTGTVCPRLVSNTLSEVVSKVCTLLKWTGRKGAKTHSSVWKTTSFRVTYTSGQSCSVYLLLQIQIKGLRGDINTFNTRNLRRGKDQTSACPSLSIFQVLMIWSLSARQVSHLHVGTVLSLWRGLIRWALHALHVLWRLEKENILKTFSFLFFNGSN